MSSHVMSILSRRAAIGVIPSTFFALSGSMTVLSETRQDLEPVDIFTPQDKAVAERWMKAWMQPPDKKAIGALHVARFADPVYFLLKSIIWEPDLSQAKTLNRVIVPIGFVTDFASIPRIFWTALRPDGLYTYAAIVHDYLYWMQDVPREQADEIFRLAMIDFLVNASVVSAIYRSVRLFGGKPWADIAEAKSRGEKRILVKFPDDPTTNWQRWKSDPSVFQ